MSFKMKYPIKKDYLPVGTKRRSGKAIDKVRFLVAHDVGNPNSTAEGNVSYYKNSANTMSASAHTFIDNDSIIECVPLTEKAWHVLYDKPKDNQLFGDDANDCAIGVELCYSPSGKFSSLEAYKRYVWYLAYLCDKFGLDPKKHIVGHETLDPGRKTDPTNALKTFGKSFSVLINDVVREYNECKAVATPAPKPKSSNVGKLVVVDASTLNVRSKASWDESAVCGTVKRGEAFTIAEELNEFYRLKSGVYITKSTKFVHIK